MFPTINYNFLYVFQVKPVATFNEVNYEVFIQEK